MWPELFVLNKDYLTEDIDRFIAELQEFRELVVHRRAGAYLLGVVDADVDLAVFQHDGEQASLVHVDGGKPGAVQPAGEAEPAVHHVAGVDGNEFILCTDF